MLLKIFTIKILLSLFRSNLSRLPLYIDIMFANSMKEGNSISCFILLNIVSMELFKSLPITSGLKISLINPWGSLDLLFFNLERTLSSYFSVQGIDFVFLAISSLLEHKISLSFLISSISGTIGLCLSLCV